MLPPTPPKDNKLRLGWVVYEEIGIAVVNNKGMARISVDGNGIFPHGYPEGPRHRHYRYEYRPTMMDLGKYLGHLQNGERLNDFFPTWERKRIYQSCTIDHKEVARIRKAKKKEKHA